MKVRVLSIDGGGAKGIIPAVILEYIENKLKELAKNPKARLSDFLDFTAGTAAGALTSTMILVPNEKGRPRYEMKDVIQQLFKFSKVYYRKKDWRTLWGRIGAKYPVEKVKNVHLETFSFWKLKDLIKPTLVTGYDILNREPVVFTNKCISLKHCDYFVKDVVRGSGASPAWIDPAEFRDGTSKNIIINSNMIANNPSLMGYIELGKTPKITDKFKRISPENVIVLSIGTGQANLPKYSFDKAKKWNKGKWFDLVTSMSIQSSTIIPHINLKNLFKSYNAEDNYIRIDPAILLGSHNIMDTSDENMKNLLQDAKNYIAANHEFLDNIATRLFNEDEIYSTMLF
jgi:uncharacterized protein